ncbi:MAG: hypothetical protein LLG00_03250 [Planctomycetaceae bacterium]|nr:hypothetical protein [Planctomycetaceae bacterium]
MRAATLVIVTVLTAMGTCGLQFGAGGGAAYGREAAPRKGIAEFVVPFVAERHPRMNALVANAFEYVSPGSGTIDAASGYPVEGWNQEPGRGLFLRSFTQLTAIGTWIDLLANIVGGRADNPYLSREQALDALLVAVRSLRHDQHDPGVSAGGLLGNFLAFDGPRRVGPLAGDVSRATIIAAFGAEKGEALWQALTKKGWLVAGKNGLRAVIQRGPHYGRDEFNGPLKDFADNATRDRLMAILDRRVVMVAFGDNANLSTSVACAIGALLRSPIRDTPAAIELRGDMERFLEEQRSGYQFLFDSKAGMFRFGWNASNGKFFGWEDADGSWKVGHSDYLVNEFRSPTMFVVLRYGIPSTAIAHLGVKVKPYELIDGRVIYTPAPWEGSAFQAFGLSLPMRGMRDPSWNLILKDFVDIELDYATRHGLPGFLSEAYSGRDAEYTGAIGIPEITVSPTPRVTDAPSLYTLGVAYAVAPDKIEGLLDANWKVISQLLTDHGPWEGYNTSTREAIRFQTSAHVLALILGALNAAADNMAAYLDSKGLQGTFDAFYRTGPEIDILAETKPIAWTPDQSVVHLSRNAEGLHLEGDSVGQAGVTFVSPAQQPMNLSGGVLTIGWKVRRVTEKVSLRINLTTAVGNGAARIPSEIYLREGDIGGRAGQEGRIQTAEIPLPAGPGLSQMREIAIVYSSSEARVPLDLSFTTLRFAPLRSVAGK